ncbi:hypothetical protein DNJ72_04060 [Prochlorococcus marinus XMU1403]|mgnify:FL=1|uniref:hypothetical protein n=1 Tax=Prochlorococcus marinus TaxID=1219 RepID=UPI000D93EA82|nr:hypothetical protein [Prochlorococcus marinus]MBW3049260.1 hypothetical protein [Prochlorococcus marinus str. MU1403]PYE02219.1 hypothetical protein DNJ72_04060 [Prochlorococcus marinus XMU1403]
MSETKTLNVLLAPEGQLQGNGQLRESFHERRSRKGEDYPMWFLNSLLVNKFKITEEEGYEAVIAEDSTTIAWLKLRFGGERLTKTLDIEELWQHASQPPEPPERRDITPPK